ncbi:MAG TPA: hypothetical protein VLG36_06315 [Candidatus Chromulinivoraceae bacterium]|nr:hypothetical protein [Candidatus Chromulinivoraceae bacterium]
MAVEDVAIRKRQQIANANRMMFTWVAIVSALVGIAIVISIFLLQKAWFNEKVLGEKSKTASTLVHNNQVISQLKDEVRVLNTNDALKSAMAPGENQPIQVVLDALPSEANSSALGSSLQEKFLNDPALTIETLNVDPVAGVESQTTSNVQDASTTANSATNANSANHEITFRFSVSTDVGNASALKSLLQRLERSIRAIDITTLAVETQGSKLVLTVNGNAFYEPAKTVDLKDKTVKP